MGEIVRFEPIWRRDMRRQYIELIELQFATNEHARAAYGSNEEIRALWGDPPFGPGPIIARHMVPTDLQDGWLFGLPATQAGALP